MHYDCIVFFFCGRLWLKVGGSTVSFSRWFCSMNINKTSWSALHTTELNQSYSQLEAPFENIVQSVCLDCKYTRTSGTILANNFVLVFSKISLITHIVKKKHAEGFVRSLPKIHLYNASRWRRGRVRGVPLVDPGQVKNPIAGDTVIPTLSQPI